MNSIMQNDYALFRLYQALRMQLLETLTDADLAFSPGGTNPTLGELCREIGEVQQAYITSFSTHTIDFGVRHPDPTVAHSIATLQAWYAQLDAALEAAVAAVPEAQVHQPIIHRGENFDVSPWVQLQIYKEALLIFYGKAAVYAKALHRPLSRQWQAWIV